MAADAADAASKAAVAVSGVASAALLYWAANDLAIYGNVGAGLAYGAASLVALGLAQSAEEARRRRRERRGGGGGGYARVIFQTSVPV